MNTREQHKFEDKYAQFQRLLILQGYSQATQNCYTRGLRRLASWCDKCPDQRLKKNDFEAYFSELLQSHSWSTIKCDRNAFMRYWELILERDWTRVDLIKPPIVKHLPDHFTVDVDLSKFFGRKLLLHFRHSNHPWLSSSKS